MHPTVTELEPPAVLQAIHPDDVGRMARWADELRAELTALRAELDVATIAAEAAEAECTAAATGCPPSFLRAVDELLEAGAERLEQELARARQEAIRTVVAAVQSVSRGGAPVVASANWRTSVTAADLRRPRPASALFDALEPATELPGEPLGTEEDPYAAFWRDADAERRLRRTRVGAGQR